MRHKQRNSSRGKREKTHTRARCVIYRGSIVRCGPSCHRISACNDRLSAFRAAQKMIEPSWVTHWHGWSQSSCGWHTSSLPRFSSSRPRLRPRWRQGQRTQVRNEREKLNLATHGAAWEREGVGGWVEGVMGSVLCHPCLAIFTAGDVASCVSSLFRNIDDLCDITKWWFPKIKCWFKALVDDGCNYLSVQLSGCVLIHSLHLLKCAFEGRLHHAWSTDRLQPAKLKYKQK